MLGHTDEEVFSPELAARFRHNDLRVLQERRSIEFEEPRISAAAPGLSSRASSRCSTPRVSPTRSAAWRPTSPIASAWRTLFSAAALAVSQSEEETLYRQLARYLSTILGVDCAFIATTVPGDRLCDCACWRSTSTATYARTSTTPGRHTMRDRRSARSSGCIPRACGSCSRSTPTFQETRPRELRRTSAHGCDRPAARTDRGRIARPFRDPALVEATLRIFAVRVNAELERAAAAAALRASEANYRQIFEASEDAIFVHDWDTGAIVDVNPRACETFGYTREELLGLRVGELTAGEPPYTESGGLTLDGAGEARRQRGLRMATPQQGRQPALGRGAPEARGDRRAAAHPRVRARDHRAQAGRGGAARERGAVPRGLQCVRRRAGAVEFAVRACRREPGLRALVRLHAATRCSRGARAQRPARTSTGGSRRRSSTARSRASATGRDRDGAAQRRAISDRGADDPDPAPGRAARARDDPRPHRAPSRRARARTRSRRSCARRRRWRRSAS